MTPAEFSREIESYLCRKNDGHLIRIVGPVFEKVCGWAKQGVPLRVAFQGIDRYFERRLAKGPAAMRRPARVEFCEADILDAFDAWRRAVGVGPGPGSGDVNAVELNAGVATIGDATASDATAGAPAGGGDASSDQRASERDASGAARGAVSSGMADPAATARRKTGLQTHIDRVMARLTQRRVEAGVSTRLADAIDALLADLDVLRGGAKGVRQDARMELVARLAALDTTFIDAARAAVDASLWQSAEREARTELDPFRGRMDEATYAQAMRAATERTFRTLARLPGVRVDD